MKRTLAVLSIAVTLVGCGRKTEQATTTTTSDVRSVQNGAPALPPGHPDIKGMMPVTQTAAPGAAPAANAGALSGTVVETAEASGYTYVKVKTASGEQWAAINQTKLKVGQPVTIIPSVTMQNFESKTLKKKFDTIVFGALQGATPGAPMMAPGSSPAAAGQPDPRAMMMAQHAAAAQGPANIGDVNVPKAEGANAKTVAELWGARTSLKDAQVTIRGKVVKFLPGIMGRNWVHLRDGSGSAAKGDEDITVTTNDVAKVGDVVVVHGVVHVDKDFGAGYKYPVIVEDAKIVK